MLPDDEIPRTLPSSSIPEISSFPEQYESHSNVVSIFQELQNIQSTPRLKDRSCAFKRSLPGDKELECSICLQEFTEPCVLKKCGHTFCRVCIDTAMRSRQACPICGVSIIAQNLVPNITVFNMIQNRKRKKPSDSNIAIKKTKIDEKSVELDDLEDVDDIQKLIDILEQKKMKKIAEAAQSSDVIISKFLKKLKAEKEVQLKELEKNINTITTYIGTISNGQELDSKIFKEKEEKMVQRFKDLETSFETDCLMKGGSFDNFKEKFKTLIKHQSLKLRAAFHFNNDINNLTSIVSSIDCDKDQEFFAVGGILKKILIYDYSKITSLEKADQLHSCFSDLTIKTEDKVSCLSYNWFHKSMLAVSSYNGNLNVYDTYVNQAVNTFSEHTARCWTCDYRVVYLNNLTKHHIIIVRVTF